MPWFIAILLLGCANGLRTMTPIAVLCWFAYTGRLHVQDTWADWTGMLVTAIVFTAFAVGEYIGDKLPQTPNRITTFPLAARMVFGGLVGAVIVINVYQPTFMGILLGALSALIGAFLGFYLRRFLTTMCKFPDFPIALAEDAVAIGLAFIALHFLTA
jgi:uncharacterized membrane protein